MSIQDISLSPKQLDELIPRGKYDIPAYYEQLSARKWLSRYQAKKNCMIRVYCSVECTQSEDRCTHDQELIADQGRCFGIESVWNQVGWGKPVYLHSDKAEIAYRIIL